MYGVSVQFLDAYDKHSVKGQEYYYLAFTEMNLGDLVVVDTRHGFALAKITGTRVVNPGLDLREVRTVVQAVDANTWSERQAVLSIRLADGESVLTTE